MEPTTLVLVIVLSAVLGDYLLGLLANLLNYRALGQSMPAEFEGTYDKEKYMSSQDYTKVRTLFSVAHSTADLAILGLFWFVLHGFEWLDVVVRGAFPSDDPWMVVPRGLTYWAVLTVAASVLDLPWELYSTFVIEERFGFNKTTLKTFVIDRLKGLLIALLLGPPIGSAVLGFFTFAGPFAWFWVWTVLTAFQLILFFVAPVWIMPLFNTFTPIVRMAAFLTLANT